MPNTPAMVGAAMTALCAGPSARKEHLETAKSLFESVGRAVIVDEKHMDAITALSGSGPAFAFVILESLAEAGVKVGTAARSGDDPGSTDHVWSGKAGAGDGTSSGAIKGRGDDSGGLHD